jgi:hypothetical protein
VRDYADIENKFNAIQAENYNLKEYVIDLQGRLLDAKADLPPPPPNVNLNHPHPGHPPVPIPRHPHVDGPGNPAMPPAGDPLAQVAQAVAQLGADGQYSGKAFKEESHSEDARAAEEIARQLQPDAIRHNM